MSSLLRLARSVALATLVASGGLAQRPTPGGLPRDVVDEVVTLFNSAQTTRAYGRHEVANGAHLAGDLAVLDGPLVIAGVVTGRVLAVNSDVDLLPGARIEGGLLVVGGAVAGRDRGSVDGDVRVYSSRLWYQRVGDRIEPRDETDRWWRRRERAARGGWSEIRLLSARTYNRVEGLPVHLGPAAGRDFARGRVSAEVLGVLRSNDSFDWNEENVGHTVRLEVELGRTNGLRIGARHYDVVAPVESWQLGDSESGLASFLLHRDFRDYFGTFGGSVYASAFRGSVLDAGLTYADERWGARNTRDPWTLFRNDAAWRPNPDADDGRFHRWIATLRLDTRNDRRFPTSGWFLAGDYEYGAGRIVRYAASTTARSQGPDGQTAYDRFFLDVRRYNRLSPNGRLNLRLVSGGWLSGDDLPLQRRFSLSGPGAMPGFPFRDLSGGRPYGSEVDYWHCGAREGATPDLVVGVPGECERFVLGQVEFRSALRADPFGLFDEERQWRRRGWGRGAEIVVFADAGRGWLVGPGPDPRYLSRRTLPPLSTLQSDVGIGLVLDDVGLYVAKAVSRPELPANFFLRLRSRF